MAVIEELVSRLGFEVNTEGLEHLNHKIESISESVKILAGIEIAKMLYELAEKFAGFGEHLESAAIQAGITVEELQKLQYAAAQNAVTADELSGGIARLGRVLFQAQKGSKGAVDAFARLGVDRDQLSGFTSTEEALYAIQDGIGNLATSQERLAVTQQLFGRGGSKFLKFLQQGSEATKQLGLEAARVGAIVSDKDVESLAKFEDATHSLGQVVKSFFAGVAGTVAPLFTSIVKNIENVWANNREAILAGIRRLANAFAYYMGIANVLLSEFGKTVHAFLYARTGIVGSFKRASEALFNYVSSALQGICNAFREADSDGSITGLFEQLGSLFESLIATNKSLVEGLDQAFGALAAFSGADTSKISGMAWLFQKLANIISTVAYGLENLSNWFNFAFKGGFGDMIGRSVFGTEGQSANLPDYYNIGQRTSAVQGLASSMSVAPVLPQAAAMASPASGPSASKIVNMQAPITVNAAPGMDEKAIADFVNQQHAQVMQKALNEADRDHSYGHVR